MRQILADRGKKRFNLGAWAAMRFLDATDPRTVRFLRKGLAEWGFKGINLAHAVFKRIGVNRNSERAPAATGGRLKPTTQVSELVRRPIRVALPARTLRRELELEDATLVPILRDPAKAADDADALFYFPGCGSERLFSDVGLATLAMLFEQGAQTVLPPGYLCCGYPQSAAGLGKNGQRIAMENRILFHRVANTLNYLDIRTVIVSCGTCMDQLLKYEFGKIFPGCRLLDIHEYLMQRGVRLEKSQKGERVRYLYHDPCHTPMKTHGPNRVASNLMGQEVLLSDRCCGEAGTLGTSRPDIANQLRFRKREELTQGIRKLTGRDRASDDIKLLTCCPACQQGLAKFADETGLKTDYIVVELAERMLGSGWQNRFIDRAREGGIERVLL
jgi:Fe-S oxidoreductase